MIVKSFSTDYQTLVFHDTVPLICAENSENKGLKLKKQKFLSNKQSLPSMSIFVCLLIARRFFVRWNRVMTTLLVKALSLSG